MSLALSIGLLLAAPQDEAPAVPQEERWYRYCVELYEEGTREGYYSAYYAFDAFLRSYPASAHASDAKRFFFDSAKRLTEVGYPERIWRIAIPFTESGRRGAQLLDAALLQYPHESFSPQYRAWLADWYFRRSEWDEAQAMYETLASTYPQTDHAAIALYRIAEISTLRFHGTAYDAGAMDDARRKFEEFLRRYPNHRLAPEARAKLQSLHELAAQKYLDDAEFYRRRGQANSAKWMYRAIIRLYGDTAAADEARARLREMGEEP